MDDVKKEYYPDGENFTCHKYLEEVPESQAGININGKRNFFKRIY